jgi:hypothetical protein
VFVKALKAIPAGSFLDECKDDWHKGSELKFNNPRLLIGLKDSFSIYHIHLVIIGLPQ